MKKVFQFLSIALMVGLTLTVYAQPAEEMEAEEQQQLSDTKALKTMKGIVAEAAFLVNAGNELFIEVKDAANNLHYFSTTPDETGFDQVPSLPKSDITGKSIEVTYSTNTQRLITQIDMISPDDVLVTRGLNKQIIVYTIKGKQIGVEETKDGLVVSLKHQSGKIKTYIADPEIYGDSDPAYFNGQELKVKYVEDTELILRNYTILD